MILETLYLPVKYNRLRTTLRNVSQALHLKLIILITYYYIGFEKCLPCSSEMCLFKYLLLLLKLFIEKSWYT